MKQKEEYEKQIFDLQAELNEEKIKNFNYLEVLEKNYQLQKELDYERSKMILLAETLMN